MARRRRLALCARKRPCRRRRESSLPGGTPRQDRESSARVTARPRASVDVSSTWLRRRRETIYAAAYRPPSNAPPPSSGRCGGSLINASSGAVVRATVRRASAAGRSSPVCWRSRPQGVRSEASPSRSPSVARWSVRREACGRRHARARERPARTPARRAPATCEARLPRRHGTIRGCRNCPTRPHAILRSEIDR